jgi:hypothetical protein
MKFIKKPSFIISLVALVVISVVVVIGHNKYFWFTNAAYQRQEVQNFFADANSGNFKAAYQLTDKNLQSKNPYILFSDKLYGLKGKNLSINYSNFISSSSSIDIVGSLVDHNLNKKFNFNINVVKNGSTFSIDSVTILPIKI